MTTEIVAAINHQALATVHQAQDLQLLVTTWPIGARVRHGHSMWLGTVVPGTPDDCPGEFLPLFPAHCYMPISQSRMTGLVCVQWDHPDTQPNSRGPVTVWPHPRLGPAWMRHGVLRPAPVRVRARERRTR